jgi:hypothetical protein
MRTLNQTQRNRERGKERRLSVGRRGRLATKGVAGISQDFQDVSVIDDTDFGIDGLVEPLAPATV